MDQEQSNIQIFLDGNLPVIIGDCPSCGKGDRTMVLTDFIPNPFKPENGRIYFKCVCCFGLFQTNVDAVSGDE